MRKFGTYLLATTILVGSIAPSYAYYSKTDYTETFEIQANESAFLIPLQGANKDSQAQFGSKAYYEANKVPVKRVQVPHVKLSGSGGINDYYVPAAKLIVVDRTTYNREWTSNPNTGTGDKHEGLRFESADSINIETDITVGASVREEDAAAFLYNFGTIANAKTVAYDPAAQYQTDAYYSQSYASIQYGRSLATVMDSVGRGYVQVELAKAFGKEKFAEGIGKKAEIIAKVEADAKAYFSVRGITIEYIGFANSLNFDKPVQDAIDGVFIATKQSEQFAAMAPAMAVRTQIANIGVIEHAGAALSKWNGSLPPLPSFAIVPEGISKWFTGWFTSSVPPVTTQKGS